MRPGINYPWFHYGGDFGPTVWGAAHGIRRHHAAIAADLAAIRRAGLEVVRWFVFTDARGGVLVDGHGWPAGVMPEALADLDALCALALDAGVSLVPVLFDHTLAFAPTEAGGARVGGHYLWLADPDGQARVLDAVVAPLARRYGPTGTHGRLGAAVLAWDLLNEPDWLVAEHHPSTRVPAPIPFAVLGAWVRDAAALLRAQGLSVTLGNARLRFASWWDDEAFGLAFLQAHAYYDPRHDLDLLDTSPAALGVSRPLVVGECAARGDDADLQRRRPALPLPSLAVAAAARGYAAVWPWSWRGVDAHGAPHHADLVAAAEARSTDGARGLTGPESPG